MISTPWSICYYYFSLSPLNFHFYSQQNKQNGLNGFLYDLLFLTFSILMVLLTKIASSGETPRLEKNNQFSFRYSQLFVLVTLEKLFLGGRVIKMQLIAIKSYLEHQNFIVLLFNGALLYCCCTCQYPQGSPHCRTQLSNPNACSPAVTTFCSFLVIILRISEMWFVDFKQERKILGRGTMMEDGPLDLSWKWECEGRGWS